MHSNKDFVRTTSLNTYTAVRVQLEHWANGEGLSVLEAAVKEAASAEAKTKAVVALEAHNRGERNIKEFCR